MALLAPLETISTRKLPCQMFASPRVAVSARTRPENSSCKDLRQNCSCRPAGAALCARLAPLLPPLPPLPCRRHRLCRLRLCRGSSVRQKWSSPSWPWRSASPSPPGRCRSAMGRAGSCGPASAGGRLTLTLTLTLSDGAGRRTGSHSTHSIECRSPDRVTVLTSSCIGTSGSSLSARVALSAVLAAGGERTRLTVLLINVHSSGTGQQRGARLALSPGSA